MGGILGGPQTVNTGQTQTQNTLQNVNQASQQNQTMNATEATAANPLAQQTGAQLSGFLTPLASTFPSWTEVEGQPWANTGSFSNAISPFASTQVPQWLRQGAGYMGQGADIINQAPSFINQGRDYFGQGAGFTTRGGEAAAAPITGQDVAGFYNPFAENVTANLQDIFGQQNLANRLGSTAQMGGVGGSRAAVGQALLAQKQGLTAGGVYADLYQRALQAAQQQKAQQVSGLLGAGQGMVGAGQGMVGAGGTLGGIGQGLAGVGGQLGNMALNTGQLGMAANQAYQQASQYDVMRAMGMPQIQAFTGALPGLIGLGQTGAQTRDLTGTNTLAGTQSGFGTGVGTGQTTYPAPSTFSQLAGLGTLGAGLFGMFSDRRAKTDIQKVGKDPSSGLPMFAFRYKGDPKTYPKVVGPMAQDVEKKYPDAVKQLDKRQGGGPVVDLSTSDYSDVTDSGGSDSDSDYSEPDSDQDDNGGLDKAALQAQARLAQQQLAQQKKRQQIARQLQQLAKNTERFQKAFPQPGAQQRAAAPQSITWPKTPWGLGQMPAMQGGGAVAPAFGGRLPNTAGMNWARSMGPAASSPSMFGGYSQPMNYGNLFASARFPSSIGRQEGGRAIPEMSDLVDRYDPRQRAQQVEEWKQSLRRPYSPPKVPLKDLLRPLQEGGRAEPETAEPPPPDAPPPIAPPATVTDPLTGNVAGFSFNADTPPGWITSSPANPRPGATSLAGLGPTQGFPTGSVAAPTGPTYGPNLGGFFAPKSAGPGPFPIVDPLTGAFVGYRSDRGVPTGWGLGQLGQRKGGRVLRRQEGGGAEDDPTAEIESIAAEMGGGEDSQIPLPRRAPFKEIPEGEDTEAPETSTLDAGASPFAPRGPRGLMPPRTRGPTTTGLPRVSGGSSNPYMALMQAGLGMLAASGQRDARGLPMSPLGAIGTGGMMGLQSYQTGLAQDEKMQLAREAELRRSAAQQSLESHRRALEDIARGKSGISKPLTIQTPLGPRSVTAQPDGTYRDLISGKTYGTPAAGASMEPGTEAPVPMTVTGTSKMGQGAEAGFEPARNLDPTGSPDETEEQRQATAKVMARGSEFKTPLKVDPDLLESMQTTPEQFDFMASRLAQGDKSILSNLGTRGGAVAVFKQALRSRSQQYWMDKGLSAKDANMAMIELQAKGAGARAIENQTGRITGALGRASETAQVVVGLSDKVNRTEYPDLNKVILAAKRRTGDENVVRFGLSMETFIKNYAAATGQGSSVLTDHQYQTMEKRLNEAWSKGQVRAVIDQGIIEINRELKGSHQALDMYLGKRTEPSNLEVEGAKSTPTGEDKRALDWANSHPNDPRAAKIKERLGQ